MIDANLKKLIESVIEVTNSHLSEPSDDSMLSNNWKFIFNDFDGWVVLKVSFHVKGGFWMHPSLYPAAKIDEAFNRDLHEFSIFPIPAGYCHVISSNDHRIEPFWGEDNNFNNSEVPLFFERFYYGRTVGNEGYIEFNQLVTHPLDLHWSQNKNSYCKFNDSGEEVEKIKIVEIDGVELVLIRRRSLDKLLYLGKWVLVRYFDFNRWQGEHPPIMEFKSSVVTPPGFQGRYVIRTCGNNKIEYSEFRGVQIIKPTTPQNELLSLSFRDEEEGVKKYAAFTVYDWKNKKILEDYLIDPANFANYFTKSELPFETSPIFFNAEVLDKYKGNPEKYDLGERSISCRGGWELQTFDVNEYNQVHTYAIYLSRLPYKEQLHWQQHNEKPNGGISERALQTDFNGQFPNEEPKLSKLRNGLEKLGSIKLRDDMWPIWSPKGGSWETASKGLFYLKTENSNQWHDFVIALANTVNEGLQTKTLRAIATHCGCIDKSLMSLGLLKFIIKATGNEQSLPETHGVLSDLQDKRSQGKAHGSWSKPEGSLIEDADRRLEQVIRAVEKLCNLFSEIKIE